ncbi:hypothetical protein [Bradyrhizobium sp. Cp5.3]|uniref:hypothetical protein n=1 Tax=Bradyrhizobium sp. Cp5.3 TaxID=443598 RepID=UPI00041910E8|nr:hypothetical protein [Bradyrhizobium sp. Cp5.3]
MSLLKLIEKTITKRRAPDPSGKQVLHWESELEGFAVLCSGVSYARTYVRAAHITGWQDATRNGWCRQRASRLSSSAKYRDVEVLRVAQRIIARWTR